MKPRLYTKYIEEVVPALTQKRGYTNVHQVPRIEKIVVNMGVSASLEKGALEDAVKEMQMITGNSTVLTTHWAYMAAYDPDTFTPPSLFPDGTLLSQEWRWTEGSTWAIQSDTLFGAAGAGTFTVTDYRNGYFWGPGSGPPSTAAETFTHIGSITPEGNVLFNVLIGGTLTSLAGQITGTGLTGRMALRPYDGSAFGPEAIATVVTVPEPATIALVAVATAAWAAVQAAGRHRSCRRSRSDRSPRAGARAA